MSARLPAPRCGESSGLPSRHLSRCTQHTGPHFPFEVGGVREGAPNDGGGKGWAFLVFPVVFDFLQRFSGGFRDVPSHDPKVGETHEGEEEESTGRRQIF